MFYKYAAVLLIQTTLLWQSLPAETVAECESRSGTYCSLDGECYFLPSSTTQNYPEAEKLCRDQGFDIAYIPTADVMTNCLQNAAEGEYWYSTDGVVDADYCNAFIYTGGVVTDISQKDPFKPCIDEITTMVLCSGNAPTA